jgi:hypothetical protein
MIQRERHYVIRQVPAADVLRLLVGEKPKGDWLAGLPDRCEVSIAEYDPTHERLNVRCWHPSFEATPEGMDAAVSRPPRERSGAS